jgi:hypothetical protein
MLIITLAGATWSDFRSSAMPNLGRVIQRGDVGLMPVASLSDPDRYRTYVALGAGREAAGSAAAGRARRLPDGSLEVDVAAIAGANRQARTGATPGVLGSQWHDHGLTTAVVVAQALPNGAETPLPEAAMVMDEAGRVDGWRVATVMPNEAATELDRAAIRRTVDSALTQYDVVVLDLSGINKSEAHGRVSSPTSIDRCVERREWYRAADGIIADAAAAIAKYHGLLAVLAPAAPAYSAPFWNRSLGPVVLYDSSREEPGGLLYSARTRWPGIVTASDFAPTVLAWWQIEGAGTGTPLQTRPGGPEKLDRLDRMIADRYRLRVPMAVGYGLYGGLAALLGLALAARPRRSRVAGGVALGVTLVPLGLAIAAPMPPGQDALYLLASAVIAVGLGLIAASATRSPAEGLAVAYLVGAAVIVSDVLHGSPLMRKSALEMGLMMGSRFYGIGNEYMGALVGMTVIGLGAWLQMARRSGKLVALVGAFVVLVIGAPFWGANWGGSVTAATGMVALWLLSTPRNTWRQVLGGATLLLLSVALPAALDMIAPPSERSHIGAAAGALLAGHAGGLADTVARKAGLALQVVKTVPWSLAGALLAAAVLWLQLRAGGPARRALGAQRALAAGIWAALIAGVVAMVVNDSGPGAGFGAVLAALGAVVFLAAQTPEVQA